MSKKPRKTDTVSEERLNEAAKRCLDQNRQGIRAICRDLNISTTKLYSRMNDIEAERAGTAEPKPGSGRPTVLHTVVEDELAELVRVLCRAGFPPLRDDLAVYVQEWAKRDLRNRKVKAWEANDHRPGKRWVKSFLKRNKLVLKRSSPMERKRKTAISDPFLIFEFYDNLELLLDQLDLKDKPERVFNTDETCFWHDPDKVVVVGVRGEANERIRAGPGKDNTTVLATCSADGKCMDPFIIFPGQRFQAQWKAETPDCPKTTYSVTNKGWMTGEIFEAWFEKTFVEYVKTLGDGPVVLIFDGHASHLSLQLISTAKANDVHLLKLPAKTTSTLQPLDVSCFAPIKAEWNRNIQKNMSSSGGINYVDKKNFAAVLTSVWRSGLSEQNIKKGFIETGIFPASREKYKDSRFDKKKLELYNLWVADGKQLTEEGSPDLTPYEPETAPEPPVIVFEEQPLETEAAGSSGDPSPPLRRSPRKLGRPSATPAQSQLPPQAKRRLVTTPLGIVIPPRHSPSPSPSAASPATSRGGSIERPQFVVPAYPTAPPPSGYKYQLQWTVVPEESATFSDVISSQRASAAQKFPKRAPRATGPVGSRSVVLTSDEIEQQIRQKEEKLAAQEDKKKERERKKAAKAASAATKPSSSKRARSPDVSSDEGSDGPSLASSDSDEGKVKADRYDMRKLQECKKLIAENMDDEHRGQFFAVACEDGYYWGKVMVVEANDVDEPANRVSFKFLHKKFGSGTVWVWPKRDDIDTVDIDNVFYGPEEPISVDEHASEPRFRFPGDRTAARYFALLAEAHAGEKSI